MTEDDAKDNMNKALFLNLVIMLGASAMQNLGKTVNPLTNKTEVDLQGAQATIDMLSMLKDKTEGNLDKDETHLISDTLASLQMNYVETASGRAAKGQDEAEGAKKPDETGATETREAADEVAAADAGAMGTTESAGDSDESKGPKYHKSYGS